MEDYQPPRQPDPPPMRFGAVAIVGAPNAGKSTLINRLVGSKISIISRKVQTTRFTVRGIVTEGRSQIVLLDTPGIFTPRRRLDRAMVRAAWDSLEEVNHVLHLFDASAAIAIQDNKAKALHHHAMADSEKVVEGFKTRNKKAILVLNKIDGLPRTALLSLIAQFFAAGIYSEVFMISALKGEGVEALKSHLAGLMPEGPWAFPEDQTADLPLRLLASEITREKIYQRVHEELPYAATVKTTKFEERGHKGTWIEQTIFVAREGHRPIMLGKNGSVLKWIGQHARADLAEILGGPVHLFLQVKVEKDWEDQPDFYQELGLSFRV